MTTRHGQDEGAPPSAAAAAMTMRAEWMAALEARVLVLERARRWAVASAVAAVVVACVSVILLGAARADRDRALRERDDVREALRIRDTRATFDELRRAAVNWTGRGGTLQSCMPCADIPCAASMSAP